MTVRHHEAGGSPRSQRDGQEAVVVSVQPVAEGAHISSEVVEPLLRRADLLSQLLSIGFPRGRREGSKW